LAHKLKLCNKSPKLSSLRHGRDVKKRRHDVALSVDESRLRRKRGSIPARDETMLRSMGAGLCPLDPRLGRFRALFVSRQGPVRKRSVGAGLFAWQGVVLLKRDEAGDGVAPCPARILDD
jgi:hypothetical protein